MSAKPVLGMICCERSVGSETAQAVMMRYLTGVPPHVDALPLLIPSLPQFVDPETVAGRIDGLLLTGSPSNVQPHHYGEAVDDAPGPFDPGRDAMAMALASAVMAKGKPVFGICRGFQELNVLFGGALRRDASAHDDLLAHHAPDEASFEEMFEHRHPVTLEPDGAIARALGKTELSVNSVHFQGVGRLGDDLTVEARAPDGLIEAFSSTARGAPVLAVQWHPEWRPEANADSRALFALMGRVLRGGELKPA
jgi:putative glutamine amidotransferase